MALEEAQGATLQGSEIIQPEEEKVERYFCNLLLGKSRHLLNILGEEGLVIS